MSITGATPLAGLRYRARLKETITVYGSLEELEAVHDYMLSMGFGIVGFPCHARTGEEGITMTRITKGTGTVEA